MKIIPPIRGADAQGSGAYGASRGRRKHKGVDVACYAGSKILSITPGLVTKIGYPYDPAHPKKGHYRYVEVTHAGRRHRYFYVKPSVSKGDEVMPDDELGEAQGLLMLCPGITDHIHFEILLPDGTDIDPTNLIIKNSSS